MKIHRLGVWLLLPLVVGAAERFKHPQEEIERRSRAASHGAELRKWSHPVYPAELKATGAHAFVRVRYVVDETGVVTDAVVLGGDERFADAALAAIKEWRYEPELFDGHLVKVCLEVNFEFQPGGPPTGVVGDYPPYAIDHSPLRPPQELRAPDPVYPHHLESRLLFGEVELQLSITDAGRVNGVGVVRTTHPDFLSAAFTAVEQWEFRPAMRGLTPEGGAQVAVLSFSVLDLETDRVDMKDWLEKNGIHLREENPPKSSEYFSATPQAVVMVDPVYPHELLTEGREGTAKVHFSVSKEGEVTDISVAESTEPAFGQSLAAAIAAWRFKPMAHQGETVWPDFTMDWKFTKPTAANTGLDHLAALIADENRAGAKELDRLLFPLYRRSPVYPPALFAAKTPGKAQIEVIINRTGRVCWPRIISATNDDFGWAAATAVSQWYFETPLRAGKPVDVKVVIPVVFKPE